MISIFFKQNTFLFNKMCFYYITFFHETKIHFYSIKNKFLFNKIYFHYITFSRYQNTVHFCSIKTSLYSTRFTILYILFFIQLKKKLFIHSILFWWAYLLFPLYLQVIIKFYFQYINQIAAWRCKRGKKTKLRSQFGGWWKPAFVPCNVFFYDLM